MVYITGTPISQTNETMGRRPHPKRPRNSSNPSSSIMDQAGTSPSHYVSAGADDSSSVYHVHKSFTSNHSQGQIHFHYQARC